MSEARERVLVAMSGGVDSTVAAALLAADPGRDVVGITLRLWPCEPGPTEAGASCCGLGGVTAARDAAGALGIPHYVLDCRETFEAEVLAPAWRTYRSGRTPNPCVLCNRAVKFDLLRKHAERLGARWLASGHHARLERRSDGELALLRGRDPDKDQSYFLFALTGEQLARTLLPVGQLTKAEVRETARRLGLPNAERAESQDACLGGGQEGFAEALRLRFGGEALGGELRGDNGQVLGRHDGIHRYTVGQRRGLGLATGRRAYVSAIDAATGTVVVSEDPRALEADGLEASGFHWLTRPPGGPLEAEVQIRYRHRAVSATVRPLDPPDRVVVSFREPQRAVTPGQAVVVYAAERVLGGGWIERATR